MKPSEFIREYVDRASEENPTDTVSVDVPLLIRLLEYAREDAKTDLDLHYVAERLIELSREGNVLTMNDYDNICPTEEPSLAEDASGGGTSSGSVATSMGGNGFGKSIFMSRTGPVKTKKKSKQ